MLASCHSSLDSQPQQQRHDEPQETRRHPRGGRRGKPVQTHSTGVLLLTSGERILRAASGVAGSGVLRLLFDYLENPQTAARGSQQRYRARTLPVGCMHGCMLASTRTSAVVVHERLDSLAGSLALLNAGLRRTLYCTPNACSNCIILILTRRLSRIYFFPQQWERSSTPLHTFQQFTTAGVEEVMLSKPYGVAVGSCLRCFVSSRAVRVASLPLLDSLIPFIFIFLLLTPVRLVGTAQLLLSLLFAHTTNYVITGGH